LYFQTKLHGQVFLHDRTRKLKSQYPERKPHVLSKKIIKEVLENPTHIRRSLSFHDDYLYYKPIKDLSLEIGDKDMEKFYSHLKYIAIVICTQFSKIKSYYPAMRIKRGEKIWPK